MARIRAAESYVAPLEIYEKAKERLEQEVAKLSELSLRKPKRADEREAAKRGV